MSLLEIISIVQYALVGGSLVLFLTMLVRGAFGEKRLRLGPTRNLDQPSEVYAGAILGVSLYCALKLALTGDQPIGVLLLIEIIPYAMIGLLMGRAHAAEAGFRKIGLLPRRPRRDLRWGLLGGWVSLGLAGAVGLTIHAISLWRGVELDAIGHAALNELNDNFSIALLVSLIISAVVMAPLIEEILFRGILQTSLLRVLHGRRWAALVIAAALFAVVHWWVVPWHNLLVLFVLGLAWGYLYERTGSLLAPILAHAVFNAANIAILLSTLK